MSISRILTVAILSAGLAACSEDGDVQPEGRVQRADTQTELTVSVDKQSDAALAAASLFIQPQVTGINALIQSTDIPAFDRIVQSAMALIIPGSIADPVPGAGIFLVYVNEKGVVVDVLTADDGLVVNDNDDGTYTVIMPDDLRVNGMVVTDLGAGIRPERGRELPDGTFYAPAVGENVELSESSTAATRVTYTFIDSFAGLTPQELKTIINNMTAQASDFLDKDGQLNLNQLTAKLEGAFASYIANAITNAQDQSMADVSPYAGTYQSFAYVDYLSTSSDGKTSEMITSLLTNTTTMTVAPEQPAVLGIQQTSTGFGDRKFITQATGAWDFASYTNFSLDNVSFNSGVSVKGKVFFSIPERNAKPNAETSYAMTQLDQIAYGASQTIGAIVASGRTQLSLAEPAMSGFATFSPELLFLQPSSYSTDSFNGKYGVIYHIRDFAQTPLSVKRGLEMFDATNGAMTTSQLYNVNKMQMKVDGVPTSSYLAVADAPLGNATFTATADKPGQLDGQYGSYGTKTLVDAGNRLLHSQIGTSTDGEAGYVTAVKLPTNANLETVQGKTYEVFGTEIVLQNAAIGYGRIKGALAFSTEAADNYVALESERIINTYKDISNGVNAQGKKVRSQLVGFVNSLDVTLNGEITFINSDRTYKGFVQEGGDFIVLHSDFATGFPSDDNYELSDLALYAVCTAGCTNALPQPVASHTVGGTVTGLTGTLVLAQNTESLNVTANGAFTFANKVKEGASYTVSISTQPTGQTCTLSNQTGTVASAAVTNVTVTCAATPEPAQ